MVTSSDPRKAAFDVLIAHVKAGGNVEHCEGQILDCKEDPSRRGNGGVIGPGVPQSNDTAKTVADAVACFACADGGIVVLGIDDKKSGPAAFVGTPVDTAWLTNRVRQLVNVEVQINAYQIDGTRIVAVSVDPAPLPVTDTSKQYRRRQGRDCQAMTPAELVGFSVGRATIDWSAGPSAFTVTDADPAAIAQLRTWLGNTKEPSRIDLAATDNAGLLRGLGLAAADGTLNRSGELLVVNHPGREPLIDLSCRPAPGAETTRRIDDAERPLATVLASVELLIDERLPKYRRQVGLVVAQLPAIPLLAVREAIVNAVMHRDWAQPGPVRVELDGEQLTVTSPGGFVPGVSESTVITAPARSRNPTLAAAMRGLRLAEQEGSGVDRMFRETVRIGLPTPQITEMPAATAVRCALIGGAPDSDVIAVVASLGPPTDNDVDVLLVLDTLESRPTVTATQLQPIIQKSHPEAIAALKRASTAGLVVETTRHGNYRLADEHRLKLTTRLTYLRRSQADYETLITSVIASHGEVRARDLIELTGISSVTASRALAAAVVSGIIEKRPSATAVGAGVFYVPAERP